MTGLRSPGVAPAVLLLLCSTLATAQQPKLGYVYPPVVKAGTTTEVQLGGFDFTADMQFFVLDERIKLTPAGPLSEFFVPEPPYWFGEKGFSTAWPIPREITARIEVPPDMPTGLVRWQVANANGISPAGVFFVSDSTEITEARIRDDQVQDLPDLPVAVSGRLQRISQVDRYRLTADADGPVSIDVMARRLGSNFNAIVEVRDSSGALIRDKADTEGVDTHLTFAATAGEAYTISIFDADFRGNRAYVYRLSVRAGPRVVATIPATLQDGESRDVEVISDIGRDTLESTRRTVSRGDLPFAGLASGLPQLAESEASEFLNVPCAVTGVLQQASPVDRFRFVAKKDESYRIRLRARAIGSPLDVSLAIEDGEGKQLKVNDDLPGTTDAGLDFKAPADGEYSCVVSDMSGRTLSRAAVYQLTLRRDSPGFRLTAVQQVLVPVGGKGQLAVNVTREGGFSGEITIRVEGLPAGVTVPDDLKIAEGKNDLKISLEAAKDAATIAARLQIVGSANINEQQVEIVATAPVGGNLCPRSPQQNETTSVLMATTMKAPVTIALVDKNRQRAVHRGTTYPAPFIINRDEGFKGEVVLQMASTQGRHRQGIHGPIMTVTEEQSEALYPCFMPEWLATDRTTRMSVMGVVQVVDPKGNVRTLMTAADARITMILEGALLKIAHRSGDLTVQPGQSFEVPIDVSQSSKLRESVRIELQVPTALEDKVLADPLTLQPDRGRAVVRIRTTDGIPRSGDWPITIKATAMQDGRWPVVSQTVVPVRFGKADR